MRKNGIDRELRPILGGVCAPEGYKANAVSCGIRDNGELDFAMILSERRCAVGCVYATGDTLGGPVKVSKKNMRRGYARAVIVNGGVANAIGEESEKLALDVCDLFFSRGLERTEIVIASTGYIGKRIELSSFEEGVSPLLAGLESSEEHSLKVAKAIMCEDSFPKQLSFAFYIGDYSCKIGVVFKGGPQVSPNMATFLAFITTDVNISTEMLQRALEAETRETLNMLNLDGIQSPNDTVCIFANGKAGNYKITCEDSEYKKFAYALRSVLWEVCRVTVNENAKKVLRCKVKNALSKQVARAVAKKVVGLPQFKASIINEEMDIESILYAIVAETSHSVKLGRLQITIRSEAGSFVLFESEDKMVPSKQVIQRIVAPAHIEIDVDMGEGNFSALAYSRIL